MSTALTIDLDEELDRRLEQAARNYGKSRGEIARDALRRQLALMRFEQVRERVMPFAEAAGFLTDEDVFRAVS
jgi:predicted transcriptional regulator